MNRQLIRTYATALVPVLTVCAAIALLIRGEAPNAKPTRPLSFESNWGQIDPNVRFVARAAGYHVLFEDGAVIFVPAQRPTIAGSSQESPLPLRPHSRRSVLNASRRSAGSSVTKDEMARPVLLRLNGMGPEAEELLPSYSNYFIGNDRSKWRTGVPHHRRIRYRNAVACGDVVFYGESHQIEYDLVLRPGCDVSTVQLHFEEAAGLEMNTTGDLLVRTGGEPLFHRKPIAWQDIGGKRVAVDVRYRISGNIAGFDVASYHRDHALIIDPVLDWGTLFGGSGDDESSYMALDGSGNAYVTGRTTSLNFPTNSNPLQGVRRGVRDAFVSAFSANGSVLLYSTYIGGDGDDQASSIAVDSSGAAWITGLTSSTDFPTTGGSTQTSTRGDQDAFILRLNSSGRQLLASTYFGGSRADVGQAIALDSMGNPVVAGATLSSDLLITPAGALQPSLRGGVDAFVVKFNQTLTSRLFATYYGGELDDQAYALAIGRAGDIYFTGVTNSRQIPGVSTASFQPLNRAAGNSAFVVRLDATGSSIVYATFLGGSQDQAALALAVGAVGQAVVGGVTTSTDFPIASNPAQPALAGASDGFLSGIDAAGQRLVFSTLLGGSSDEYITSVRLDSEEHVYAAGFTESRNFLSSVRPPPSTPQGFILQVGREGDRVRVLTYIGSIPRQSAVTIDILRRPGNDEVYASGTATPETVLPPAQRPPLLSRGGGLDAFVLRLANADVTFRVTQQAQTVVPGANVETVFVATNRGPSDAELAEVIFALPPGFTAIRCGSQIGTCSFTSNEVRVSYASLKVGASDTITISARTSPSIPQGTETTLAASVISATNDPAIDNNGITFVVASQGVVPFTVVPPALLDFGDVNMGDTRTGTVNIRPNGAQDIELLLTSSTGTPNPRFSVNSPASPSVRISNPLDVTLAFRPAQQEASSGQLDIRAPDAGYVTTVDLRGNGIAAALNLPTISAVVEGAGFRPVIAANSWVTLRGSNLAPRQRTWQSEDFRGNALPVSLDGVSVAINNRAAYVAFISPTQLNVLAPADPVQGQVTVTITTPTGSANASVSKQDSIPGFFLFPENFVAARFTDFSLVGRAGLLAPATSRPARPGEVVLLYLNGLGATNPTAPDGIIPQAALRLVNSVEVRIGGAVASQSFAGLTVVPGLFQINATVPDLPDGDYPVVVTTGGRQTQSPALLSVRR